MSSVALNSLGISASFLNICILFFYCWLHWVFVATDGVSLVAENRGYSLVAVHRLLFVVASLVVEHRF